MGEGAPRQARPLRAGGGGGGPHHPAAAGRGRRRCTATTSGRSASGGSSTSTISSGGCADVLEQDAEFAAAQRWRFRHLFVDEFQDASAAQFRLAARRGSATAATSAWSATRPGDLRVRRRRRGRTSCGFTAWFPPEQLPRRRRRRSSAATTGRPPRWSPAAGAVLGRRAPRAGARGPARRTGARVHRVHTADDEARGVARALRAARERGPPVDAHGGAVPGERAVGAVRGGADPRRRAVPRPRRRPVPRPPRGAGRARQAPRRWRARHPARPFAEHLTDFAADAEESPRSGASTPTRSCASATSTSRPKAGRAASTASSSSCRPRCAARTPSALAAMPSSCSRSTGRRASSSTPCSSPGSSGGWSRSRTRRPAEAMDEEQRLLYVALEPGRARAATQLGARADRRRTHVSGAAAAAGSRGSKTRRAPPAPRRRTATAPRATHRRRARPRRRAARAAARARRTRRGRRGRRAAVRGAGRVAPEAVARGERARVRHLPQHHARRDRHRAAAAPRGRCSTSPVSARSRPSATARRCCALVAEHDGVARPG